MRRGLAAAIAVATSAALALALGGCSGGAGAGSAGSPSASPRLAPFAIDQDFADPGAIVVGDTVYAYATNAPGRNVQVATSTDLRSWTVSAVDALPELPAWAVPGKTWAPGPAALPDGRYALYITATDASSGKQCIGAVVGEKPSGPFASGATVPLVCPTDLGGAIDASSFVDRDGSRYLIWKNDGNCCGQDTWLWAQPLSADGLSIAGPATQLVKQTLPWEGHLVEAPVVARHDGGYALLYSANDYGTDRYAVGVATAPALTGPYTKQKEPLLSTKSSGGRYLGPGGEELITVGGKDWMLFHSWDESYAYRGLHAVPVTWRAGVPVPRIGAGR
ncbi:glycoside hydrolase family 43 protein [Leifsonia sp. AG29]|uniref:glycoside hydrolase family 43 protein n=1 Tax=Leifsonia sp. AG29 TaxID=2598860 RepID=UPI00131CAC49|nr:glycoside hydrolase family 43 protein [Leifsonia sp. AG29]